MFRRNDDPAGAPVIAKLQPGEERRVHVSGSTNSYHFDSFFPFRRSHPFRAVTIHGRRAEAPSDTSFNELDLDAPSPDSLSFNIQILLLAVHACLFPKTPLISNMEVLPPDVLVCALDTMSHGHPLIRTSTPSSSNSPEFYAFQKLLRQLYRSPDLSLRNVQRLRGHLHRLYTLQRMDGAQLTLKCAPSPDTRLLRAEERGLETEAKILHMIRTSTQVPVPQRVSCDLSTANSLRTAYLLRSYIHGTSLADLTADLSRSERAGVDRALGFHLRSLCQLQLESFGTTHRVAAGRGHATWSKAFSGLLEAILRDCEDALISLPYEIIRCYAGKHKHYLDDIREPRFIPLDVGGAQSVLLDDRSKQVVGLLGFSNIAWGDPMLADVFSDPSEAFWQGFGGRPVNDAGYRVRRLLYYTYRSVVALATHYYRPQQNAGESDARRVMTWAITQLDAI